jgi:hypothetical protein
MTITTTFVTVLRRFKCLAEKVMYLNHYTRDFLLLFCMFALRKDERKLQYSRNNILGFINTGYFTSDNVPTELRMQRTIDFRISEES